jgi:hypothetical protein
VNVEKTLIHAFGRGGLREANRIADFAMMILASAVSVLETLGSREVSDSWFDPVCFGTESPLSRYAPSENQK